MNNLSHNYNKSHDAKIRIDERPESKIFRNRRLTNESYEEEKESPDKLI
jgi:hypothetical protein